jgi:hypothetical protein
MAMGATGMNAGRLCSPMPWAFRQGVEEAMPYPVHWL